MSDVGADVLAEWRVVPENAVSLSVFALGGRGGFVAEGVLGRFCRMNEALSDERDENRLLMPADMFFVVIGG